MMLCRLLLFVCALSLAGEGASLVVTVTGTGSGTLNGVAFNAAAFTFTLTSDTTLVAKPPCCSTMDTPSGTPATFLITGAGSGNLTDIQAIFVSPTSGEIGLAHFNDGDVVDLSSSALNGYTLGASIGPISGTPSLVGSCPGANCSSFTTSVGTLSFSSISNVTFTAAVGGAAPAQISTVAGTGVKGFSGDGGQATAAMINTAVFEATDPAGNIYIADQGNNRIRKIDTAGIISTVAGTGTAGFSGDNSLATSATLTLPTGIFVDAQGNLIVADSGNQRIRKINAAGVITTAAGNGGVGFSGDGGPAIAATFHNPVRAIADAAGNLYIADQSNHRVRKVSTTGIVTTVAGTGTEGFSGDGTLATGALLDNPTAVALDSAGNLYFSDQLNHRIRKVDTSGIITTIAGNGSHGYAGDGSAAVSASLNYPGGLVVDTTGNIFFADDLNYRIRKIAPGGIVSTVAGNGTQGYSGDGGPATAAMLSGQFGVALTASGDLLIADSENNRIRKVEGVSPVAPMFATASVTNGASFAPGGSAGGLATVFGQHLSVNFAGVATATTLPILPKLAGSTVTVDGFAAPLLAVVNSGGSEQINFQIPWGVAGQSTVQVVINNGVTSTQVPVSLTPAKPGIFSIDGVIGAIEHADGSVVTAAKPAANGEVVIVFATGLGPVTPPVLTGQAAQGLTLSRTDATPIVTVGGLPAAVLFSGEAPGFVGLNQLNIQLPTGMPSGPQDLVMTVSGSMSNTVKIQVK